MPISSLDDVLALEKTPFSAHVSAGSVYEQLASVAARRPDKTAITMLLDGAPGAGVEDWSFAAFLDRVHRMAHLFRAHGVERESAVSILSPGLPDAYAGMFAAYLAGRANPINFMLEPGHIAALIRAARGRVLLVPDAGLFPGVMEKLPAILAELPDPPAVFRLGGEAARGPGEIPRIDEALADQPGERPDFWFPPAKDDIAALFHTGGTTSAPKLAYHTHGGILRHCWALSKVWRDGEDEIYFNGLPPFHVGGGYAAGIMPLSQGAKVVLMTPAGYRNREVMAHFWKHVDRFRPSVIAMVPTSWGAVMNTPLEGADISSIRLCHAGGAAMPVEAAREVEKLFGVQIVEGWGMTELHGFGTMNPAEGECRIGSVGYRLPFVELCIAEVEEGRVRRLCDADESGRVLVRGAQLFGGYLDPAHEAGAWFEPPQDETRAAWSAGGRWFDTGDLGRIDAEGYIWLTGRSKDAIIRGGHNIDPLTIEEALYAHPAVETAAAIGRPDDYAGELPMAFVQLREGISADGEELRVFARERIAERAAAPVEVIVVETIPLTAVGKIFKPTLREEAARRVIAERLKEIAPGARISARHDKRRGLVISIDAPENMAEVKAALSGFSLQFDLNERA